MAILGVLAALFSIKHESLTGGTEDPPPESAPEIVWNIIMAIVVYAVRRPAQTSLPFVPTPTKPRIIQRSSANDHCSVS